MQGFTLNHLGSVAALFLAALLPSMSLAQDNTAGTGPARPAPLQLNVVVTPNSGGPVANLPQSAFTVLDNGQPQSFASFRAVAGKDAATEVLIVVDSVNIRYTQLAYARQQLADYLKQNDGQLNFPTSLVLLSDTSLEATPFTTDGNGLSKTLEDKTIGLRDLRRDSGFYGAQERLDISLKGLGQVLAKASEAKGHKIILWMSPGWPLLSGPGIDLTAKQAEGIFQEVVGFSTNMHRANVTLYSIDPLGAQESVGRTFYYEEFLKGIEKPSQAQLGDLGLQVLAVQSGGLALSSSNDVRGLLAKAMRDTTAEYQITLPPPTAAPDGDHGYHRLEVRVAQPETKARTDQGFYTQP